MPVMYFKGGIVFHSVLSFLYLIRAEMLRKGLLSYTMNEWMIRHSSEFQKCLENDHYRLDIAPDILWLTLSLPSGLCCSKHFVTDLLILYTKLLPISFYSPCLASFSLPTLSIISHRYFLISPPHTGKEALWSFYCLVHCCIQGAQNNFEHIVDIRYKYIYIYI